jgi:flagellar hook protein FlgE
VLIKVPSRGHSELDASVSDPLLEPVSNYCDAKPTTRVEIAGNLDSGAHPPTNRWSVQSSSFADRANFSTTINVFDLAGNDGVLDIYYVNVSSTEWDYHAIANGSVEVGTGRLTFDDTRALSHHDIALPLHWPASGGGAVQEISLDLGTPTDQGGRC